MRRHRRSRAASCFLLLCAGITLATGPAAGTPAAAVARLGPAVAEPAPWEPGDREGGMSEGDAPATPSRGAALALVHWYQRRIAPRSVSRCPFAVSCSSFAARAVREQGALAGMCRFIDRNLYRENPGMTRYYDWIELPDGSLRLDDTFYLDGGR